MTTSRASWQPSIKWHLICLGSCLAACCLIYGTLWFISSRLPAPYQPRTPVHGTTPWK